MEKIVSLANAGVLYSSHRRSMADWRIPGIMALLALNLKNNVKRAWWKSVVYERDDILGMDAAILMHPKVWQASGHVENFFDLKSDCKSCKKRFKSQDLKDNAKCPECGRGTWRSAGLLI